MEQADVVSYVLTLLERLNLRYAVVGSFASMAFGEPRFTRDIDILIDLPVSRVPELCQAFPGPDWYVSLPTATQAVARRTQFNVIHTTSGNKIDFMIAKPDAWHRLLLERRVSVGILHDTVGYSAHPEDVILGKLQYFKEGGSDKHLRDIAGILAISGEMIDRERLQQWAGRLNVADVLQSILEQAEPD